MRGDGVALDLTVPRRQAADFVALVKLRIVLMVLVTTVVGFYLGSSGGVDYLGMLATAVGTGLAAAGTLALNQYLERDVDARMHRTRLRPLPDGRLQPTEALVFGMVLTAAGLVILVFAVNVLSAFVTTLTALNYLLVYTPLKRTTPLCSVFGAVSGALPPVTGWTAARGELSIEACILFAILFLWQMPHSLTIAWLYREDYARAGVQLLPVVEPDGWRTSRQITANCLALLAVSTLPTALGVCGTAYLTVATLLGFTMVTSGIRLAWSRTASAARRLLLVTLLYLPVLLVSMALDKVSV